MNWSAAIAAYLIMGVLAVVASYANDRRRMGAALFWAHLPAHVFRWGYPPRFVLAVLAWPWFVAFLLREHLGQ